MLLLTGETVNDFRFVPQSLVSFGNTVIVEGCDGNRNISWVHAWTVTDGIITQVREYFNTSLTVTRIGDSDSGSDSGLESGSVSGSSSDSVYFPCVWESTVSNRISLTAIVSQCIDLCLKPLGQSSLVSQILGGMVFGPSGLGHEKAVRDVLFPLRGALVFETIASLGLMFFFFVMSVKMDPATLIKTEKQAITIGLSVFSFTLAIPTGLSILLKKYVYMDKGLRDSITMIALSQALTVFICIRILLSELKILNTDTGRLALSSALSADVIGFTMMMVMFSIIQNKGGKILSLLWVILALVAIFLLIVYLLTEKEFTLMVVSVLVINAILTPLLRFIYDPLQQYNSVRRCSIQHTKHESELRVMVCIHNNENIPTTINLLEASHASSESSVVAIALILTELLGRSRPLLVAHQHHETLRSASCSSAQIDNALRQYARQNEGSASVYSFTSMSEYDTMHGDVCRISLEMGANILIMPFHKRWEIDGSVEVISRSIQTMNIRVLDRAPCSVGILIDRGILSGFPSLLSGRVEYNVAVLFIGGADDAEALVYSTRMARHASVSVTVIRFLLFGEENSKDRKHDSDLIEECRYYNAANRRFDIMEHVVRDGVEISTTIRRLIDYFDLVIVGKEHSESVLLQGHDEWSECKELGIIGDMLASQDFVTKASVLVVQQQRIRKKLIKHTVTPITNQRDYSVNNVPNDAAPRSSISISV
ncbi:unnamed protein product [Lupinus luteus]|uniref:Cation/H+ exchanger domain-containing protein n=1 Tax=Lupinus luteus TaxID=3873 RepID=A0AAV1Y472_LUPLU